MRRADPDRESVVFGLFKPGTPLHPIIDRLRGIGYPDEAIEIASTLPLLYRPFAADGKWGRLYPVTIVAGAVGILFGILLAGGTALLYPINTGGKPIISIPVVGIIAFEMMMLFAIVATFITAVVKIRRAHSFTIKITRDPRIDDGFIGISVRVGRDDSKIELIQKLFREWEATEVRR